MVETKTSQNFEPQESASSSKSSSKGRQGVVKTGIGRGKASPERRK
jgi:hypothetical protein